MIDEKTVTKIAKLARIKLSDSETQKFTESLNGTLDWFECLQEVDTEGVKPMTSVVHANLPKREDVVTDGGKAVEVTKNAPKSEFECFVVPKVIDQG